MAITQVSTSVLKDGAVTSAKLDTNIAIDGNLTVDTNTLYVDSADNRVGIGTTSPSGKLQVTNGTAGRTAYLSDGDDIVIDSTGSGSGMTIASDRASYGVIYFADQDNGSRGILRYDHADNSMRLSTNGTERMRITSVGNVGIGTTNPTQLFEVAGGTQIKSNGIVYLGYTDATAFGGYKLEVNGKIRIGGDGYFSGNVGIGTSSPTSYFSASDNLVVKQASGGGGITVVTDTSSEGALYFADGINGSEQYRGGIAYNHSLDKLFLVSGGASKVTIESGGNVGIGTASPNGNLDVRTAGQSGVPSLGTAGNGINLTRTDGQVGGSIGYTTEGHIYIQSQRFDSASSNNLFLQPVGGNVGIGTDSPNNKLTVSGDGGGSAISYFNNTNSTGYGVLINTFDTNNARYALRVNTGVGTVFNVGNGGNVGIGETNPSEKLEVKDGSIRTTTLNSFSNLISGRASVPTAAGYNIGGLLFQAYRTGTTYATGAAIFSYSDGGAWTSTSVPSYLSFHTAAVGAANTTERMIIDSNGDLTLGATTSPKLYMRSTGGNGNNQRFYIDGFADGGGAGYGGGFRIHTRDSVNVWHERMRITSSGNVGIGTTNPTDKLSVYTSTDYGNNSEYANATIGLGNTAYPVSIRSYRYGGSYLNGLDLYYNNGTPQLGMRITSVGNVGIGTASPDAQLTIEGNSPIINIRNKQESESGIRFVDTATDAQSARIMYDSGASNALIFYNNATNERMRILSSGGITFNGDTATANALDDYEEGTWTPSFSDEGNVTSLVKQGDAVYTKIGRVVHLTVEVAGAFTSSTAESSFSFTIPFLAYSTTFDNVGTATFFIGSGADRFGIGSVFLGTTSNGKTFVYIPAREVQQSGSWGQMRISLTYFAS